MTNPVRVTATNSVRVERQTGFVRRHHAHGVRFDEHDAHAVRSEVTSNLDAVNPGARSERRSGLNIRMNAFLTRLTDLALKGLMTPDQSRLDPIIVGTILGGSALIVFQAMAILILRQEFDPVVFGLAVTATFSGQSLNLLTQHRAQKGGVAQPENVTPPVLYFVN